MNWRICFSKTVVSCAATVAVMFTPQANALSLDIDSGGVLLGAKGVSVNGTLYDVEFVDGTCDAVFSDCMASFTFGTEADAILASEALIDSVFTDSSSGSFLSKPWTVRGISSSYGNLITPFAADATDIYAVSAFLSSGISFTLDGITYSPSLDTGSASGGALAWARWTTPPHSSTVPEPSLMALLLAGAFVLWSFGRNNRTKKVVYVC